MGKLADRVLSALDRALNGSPAEQAEDARLLAERRAVNCPNCGDTNEHVILETLPGGAGTRPMCDAVLDMDGRICGCQHQYHAA